MNKPAVRPTIYTHQSIYNPLEFALLAAHVPRIPAREVHIGSVALSFGEPRHLRCCVAGGGFPHAVDLIQIDMHVKCTYCQKWIAPNRQYTVIAQARGVVE